ncbi:hypothetical protein B0I35DRAFT_515748 [Stachybotrys elegans]|uniref:HNH nuclease domain-containing protein n=1 Tax=Stachybotrys elegans TaxID=80388 RepID=A0A8K0SIQ3_9HYPO|nr:hypothetical protein B0I35DRAFT_515748 [Stachybotrys elegans]
MTPADVHYHQSSLRGIIDFSAQPPLASGLRLSASRRFYQIVNHFEASNSNSNSSNSNSNDGYNRVKLVRLTYEYARSEESKSNFLRAFFQFVGLPIDGDDGDEDRDENDGDEDSGDEDGDKIIDMSNVGLEAKLHLSLLNFADYLFDNFFLPLKASSGKTLQPSPTVHSAAQGTQPEGQFSDGEEARVAALRGSCLIRDRHCCVISRSFDAHEAMERFRRHGDDARDDNGIPFLGQSFALLEVAHILPHSLTRVNSNLQLDASKDAALAILNMFDSGAASLVQGTDIDRPRNAMTLTDTLRIFFGSFDIFFEPVDQQAHTYRIDAFLPPVLFGRVLPVVRTLHLTESQSIDPPSPRLLAIHSAIAHILHLSGAGHYINEILRDLEGHGVREDGSTKLDSFNTDSKESYDLNPDMFKGTPILFPQKMVWNTSRISGTSHLGPTKEEPMFTVQAPNSIVGHFRSVPETTLLSGSDKHSPAIASVLPKKGEKTYSSIIRIAPKSGDLDLGTLEIDMTADWTWFTKYKLTIPVRGRPDGARFEWRSREGEGAPAPSDGFGWGWRLVRTTGNSAADKRNAYTNKAEEIVAVSSPATKIKGSPTFCFVGSAARGELGEAFEIAAVMSFIRLHEREPRNQMVDEGGFDLTKWAPVG